MGLAADKKEKKEKKEAEPVKVKVLLKEARTAIKNSSNQSGAEKKLTDALSRPELTNSERAEILHTAALLRESVNNGENTKAYLKQNYDTITFFSTILGMYDYVMRCDSVDVLPNNKGEVKPQYRQKGREMLLKYRKNLLAGGNFMVKHQKYAEAMSFFKTYLTSMDHPMLDGHLKERNDSVLRYKVTYWTTYSAHNAQRYDEVVKHVDYAIEGMPVDSIRMALMEVRCHAWANLGDTTRYVASLVEGVKTYPRDDYFFLHLMDYHQSMREWDRGLQLSDTLTKRVGPKPEYFFAKSLMYRGKGDDYHVAVMCDSVLTREPDHKEALYNKGIALLNMATTHAETAPKDARKQMSRKDREYLNSLYRAALTPMKHLRELTPNDKDKWGRPLYRIYLYLNMGKEFEEMERLLK